MVGGLQLAARLLRRHWGVGLTRAAPASTARAGGPGLGGKVGLDLNQDLVADIDLAGRVKHVALSKSCQKALVWCIFHIRKILAIVGEDQIDPVLFGDDIRRYLDPRPELADILL